MPFKNSCLDNIVLIDVLHHFDKPLVFFQEAVRVLRRGGRILICDPYLSAASYVLWKYIHPEGCDTSRLGYDAPVDANPLMCANSASLTILLAGRQQYFRDRFPDLAVIRRDYHTVMHYWLAGGYNFPSFLPESLVGAAKYVEKILSPLGRFLASFAFAVLEKKE
jgi:SAM-dependent methyltransferase